MLIINFGDYNWVMFSHWRILTIMKGVEHSKNAIDIVLIWGLALLFIVFNFVLISWTSTTGEISLMQQWGNSVLNGGIFNLYKNGGTDYPPLYVIVLGLNSWINLVLFGNNNVSTFSYMLVSKMVPTLCIFISGMILFLYLREKNRKIAYITFITYIFNIALLYNSAYWGQVDSVYSMFILISVLFILRKRYILSSLFLMLGFLTKAQSLVFVPVIWAVIFFQNGIIKTLKIVKINLLIMLAFLIPFYLTGGGLNMIKNFFPVGVSSYVSLNAYNFWFLIFPGFYPNVAISDNQELLFISMKSVGLILLGIYGCLVLYQLYKKNDNKSVVLAMSSVALGFFMLPTEIHERYMFPFFVLFSLIFMKSKKYILVYVVSTFTYLINMMMTMSFWGNFVFYYQIQDIINYLIKVFSFEVVAMSIAGINLTTFIYFSKIGIFKNLGTNIKSDLNSIKSKW